MKAIETVDKEKNVYKCWVEAAKMRKWWVLKKQNIEED